MRCGHRDDPLPSSLDPVLNEDHTVAVSPQDVLAVVLGQAAMNVPAITLFGRIDLISCIVAIAPLDRMAPVSLATAACSTHHARHRCSDGGRRVRRGSWRTRVARQFGSSIQRQGVSR
jgi:hypothetical protein